LPSRTTPSAGPSTCRRTTHGAHGWASGVPGPRPGRWTSNERHGAHPRAQLGRLTHFPRRRLLDAELVREQQPGSFGFSLSGMQPELAFMYLYRVLVTLELNLKRCESRLDPVPSAALKASRLWHTCGPSPSSVCTESIGYHLALVTGIGAVDAGTMSALSGPWPVAEHPRTHLPRRGFQCAPSARGRCTRRRLAPTAACCVLCWRGVLWHASTGIQNGRQPF